MSDCDVPSPEKATSPCEPTSEMTATLDYIQRTYSCSLQELLVWSDLLVYRFSSMTELENVIVTKQYFDSNNRLLDITEGLHVQNTSQSSQSLPDNVQKVTLRAYYNAHKNVTLTLYLKYKSDSGTVLVQGKGCPDWADKEFPLLGTIVKDIISSSEFPWRDAVDAVPMYFVADASTSVPSPAGEDDSVSATVGEDDSVSAPSGEAGSVSPPDKESSVSPPAEGGTMPPPTEEGSVQAPAGEEGTVPLLESQEASQQTAVKQHISSPSTKRKQRRRATVFSPAGQRVQPRAKPSPSVSVSVLNRLTQLQLDLEELSTTQTHFQNQVTCISEDIKTSTKNELRPIMNNRYEEIMQHIEAMETRVGNLEKQNAHLLKENQSLKTQVGTLHASMKKIKPKSTTNADTQTHCTQATTGQHANSPSTSSQPILPTVNQTLQDKTQLTSHVTLQNNTQLTAHVTPTTPTGSHQPDAVNNDNSPTPHYTIQTSNSFNVLAEDIAPEKETDTQNITTQAESKTETSFRTVTKSKRSPKEILSNITINEHTTAVLIGDSIIKSIDPQRLSQRHHVCQKVCVPGMTVADVQDWLGKLPVHPSIHVVTLHVGVNNCSSGQVTQRVWTELIVVCQRAFPRALIRLSSVIPARGRHNLNNTILPSNRHLAAACENHGAVFINNYSTFTAISGAPRLDLYKDVSHPSAKGTAKLAVNIMFDNHRLSGLSTSSSPVRDSDQQNIPYRDVRPRSRRPRLHQGSQEIPAPSNLPPPTFSQPPPPSLYHYPPLIPNPKPSIPPPPPPVHHWYPSGGSLPASVDWDTTSRDAPVRHPGNPNPPRPPTVYPPPASSTPHPDPARPMQCEPPAGPLHPLAVHFLNMAARVYAQQTAVY